MTDHAVSAPRGAARASPLLLALKLRTFIALIAVFVFFSFAAPNFLSAANIVIMAKHVAITAILAIGMTYVIVAGGIDLSVGSIVGLTGMVAGGLLLHGLDTGLGWTIWFNTVEIVLICLGVGVAVGAVNGLLITRLNVTPFIATLGTLYAARGLALLSSDGATFPNLTWSPEYGPSGFGWLGAGLFLGVPILLWALALIGLAAAYVGARTPLGRRIYAVGGNERAAALSGVRVNTVKLIVYMFSGFCAAVVGLVIASQLQAAHPATGETFELNAIAAAVLGGASMSGGRGKVGGAIIGAFVIGVLSDGLVMTGVSSFWQTVIKGVVIVAAVVIDQAQQRMQARADLRRMAA